jgi:hypothetical protein
VLHADQRRAIAEVAQDVGKVLFGGIDAPAEGAVRQTEDARGVRITSGVQRGTTRTALRRRAKALVEADAAGGQIVQGRRRDGRLPIAAEMLPEIVAGEKQDVRSGQVESRLSP